MTVLKTKSQMLLPVLQQNLLQGMSQFNSFQLEMHFLKKVAKNLIKGGMHQHFEFHVKTLKQKYLERVFKKAYIYFHFQEWEVIVPSNFEDTSNFLKLNCSEEGSIHKANF